MGREEGSGWGTHVYLWRIHFDIWQNQYNIVKFKNKIKFKKRKKKKGHDSKVPYAFFTPFLFFPSDWVVPNDLFSSSLIFFYSVIEALPWIFRSIIGFSLPEFLLASFFFFLIISISLLNFLFFVCIVFLISITCLSVFPCRSLSFFKMNILNYLTGHS